MWLLLYLKDADGVAGKDLLLVYRVIVHVPAVVNQLSQEKSILLTPKRELV